MVFLKLLRYGEQCDCDISDEESDKMCTDPKTGLLCSNQGSCHCGVCECLQSVNLLLTRMMFWVVNIANAKILSVLCLMENSVEVSYITDFYKINNNII